MSEAVTRTFFRLPPATASRAVISPSFPREAKREIGGDQAVPEIQGRLEDPGVLAVGEGERRRAEVAPVDLCFIHPGQAVAAAATAIVSESSSWLHIERSPWATMTRAGANHPSTGRSPTARAAGGDVGAVGSDSDHRLSLLLSNGSSYRRTPVSSVFLDPGFRRGDG